MVDDPAGLASYTADFPQHIQLPERVLRAVVIDHLLTGESSGAVHGNGIEFQMRDAFKRFCVEQTGIVTDEKAFAAAFDKINHRTELFRVARRDGTDQNVARNDALTRRDDDGIEKKFRRRRPRPVGETA